MVAILGYSREQIFSAVKDMYTTVAEAPDSPFHFPVGGSACRLLGYPSEQVERLPERLLESFAGVGYPFKGEAVRPGDTSIDIGAGAGTDSLIAGQQVGPSGHVIALDLTPAMTRKLHETVTDAGATNVSVVQASAESIPIANESVDSITSNGALNLVPDKRRAVAEMFRVLRPGGRLQIADVVINRPVTVDCSTDPRLWVECVVGATVEENFLALFRDAGFEDVQILRTNDYFSHSPSAQTREIAASFDARSIEVTMRRGAEAPSRLQQWLRRLDPRRIAASIWRQGLTGMFGLGMALLSCYGTLAAVGLLSAYGAGLVLNETLWAGTIALFTVLTAAATVAGARFHREFGPPVLGILGAGLVLYALFIDYRFIVELTGFVMLAGAVVWDWLLKRRHQARVLGLDGAGH
jgi:arsenite methyltransferase